MDNKNVLQEKDIQNKIRKSSTVKDLILHIVTINWISVLNYILKAEMLEWSNVRYNAWMI